MPLLIGYTYDLTKGILGSLRLVIELSLIHIWELWQERAGETTRLEGVEARTEEREGFLSETVRILDAQGEQALGKPEGTYVTLTMDGLQRREEDAFGPVSYTHLDVYKRQAESRAVRRMVPLMCRERGVPRRYTASTSSRTKQKSSR